MIPELQYQPRIILQGNLAETSVVSVLQLVKLSGKNGVLHFSEGSRRGRITIQKNMILSASSPEDLTFGEFLISHNLVEMDHLTRALELQKHMPAMVGEILQGMGVLENRQESMSRLLNRFLREVVFRLMRWTQGRFEFEDWTADDVAGRFDASVGLEMDFLLLENAQRVDEWRAMAANISSIRSVLKINRSAASEGDRLTLDHDQWLVLSYVNGRRTILRILEKIGHDETAYLGVINRMVRDRLVIEKRVEAMRLVVPARITVDNGSRERHFPGRLSANLLYKEIDGRRHLVDLAESLGIELSETWENLVLLVRSELVEIRHGRREYQDLMEEF